MINTICNGVAQIRNQWNVKTHLFIFIKHLLNPPYIFPSKNLEFCSWEKRNQLEERIKHVPKLKNNYGCLKEEIALCSWRFRKVLTVGVVFEWSFIIPVESESVKMGELAVYMSTEGESSKEEKGNVCERTDRKIKVQVCSGTGLKILRNSWSFLLAMKDNSTNRSFIFSFV